MKTESAHATPNAEAQRTLRSAENKAFLQLRGSLRSPRLCVRILRLLYCSAPIILTCLVSAATNDLTSALQRGLFEEEANRNLEAAAQAYRDVSAQFDKDRKVAATAVFRLGEIYRKQGKTNEAVVQYERIVREFSDQQPLATLSRQNLANLGAKRVATDVSEPVQAVSTPPTPEAEELARTERILLQLNGWDLPQLRRLIPTLVPDAEFERLETQLVEMEVRGNVAPEDFLKRRDEVKKQLEARAAVILNTLNRRTQSLRDVVSKQLAASKAVALSPAAPLEQHRLLEAEIKLLEGKIESEKLLVDAGRADDMTLIATQRELLALKRQLAALSPGATPEDIRTEQSRLLDEEIGLVEQRLARVRAMATDRENSSVVADAERELLALKRQRVALAAEPLWPTTPEGGATLTTDDEEKEIRRIQAMIQNSPDLINAGEGGVTPLARAASAGWLRVAKFLLEHGALIDRKPQESTPLHHATAAGHKAMVELLLERGANVDARDGSGGTALHLAAEKGFLSVAEVLIKHKADPNARNGSSKGEKSVLHAAVQHGNVAVVDLLLANGADVNVRDSGGYTPSHFAATLGLDAVVEQLLRAGADVDAFDNSKQTPLFLACADNRPSVVRQLLAAKANPNRVDDNGRTALSYSVSPRLLSLAGFGMSGLNPGCRELVKILLEAKADPNRGLANSPLLLAVRADDAELAELLLRAGANPNQPTECEGATMIRNPDGSVGRRYERRNRTVKRTPLQASVLEDHPAMVKLLLQFKADLKAMNPDGEPLVLDTLNNPEMLKVPLDAGADPNATDRNGQTLLRRVKIGYRNSETVELLRQHGGLDELPDFTSIRLTRGTLTPITIFSKDTRSANRFTLFEVLANHYANSANYVLGGSFSDRLKAIQNVQSGGPLSFPDFMRIRIRRASANKPTALQEITVNLLGTNNSINCAKDMPLEFGDIIEIPEREHTLAEPPVGLTDSLRSELTKCVERRVRFVVRGETSEVTLQGYAAYLTPALNDAQVQRILRSSSDLSRIMVKRTNSQAGKPLEILVDAQQNKGADELWLRDGDVIEVPDK